MKKIAILGGGESGCGAALLGKKLGYSVFLSDKGKIGEEYRKILEEKDIPFEEGGHSLSVISKVDIIVKSPGIPDTVPIVRELRNAGKEIVSEIEFAGRHSDAVMCCITGSNGKTTTTLLLYHILKTAGMDVGLAGNVGSSLAAQVADNAHGIYVVELSSFQLDDMYDFKADVAIITNITPDHLDRYDYELSRYADAKMRILRNMEEEDLVIYGKDSPLLNERISNTGVVPRKAPFTAEDTSLLIPDSGAFIRDGLLVARFEGREFKIRTEEIGIKGRHNMYNAMAAVLAALKLKVEDKTIAEALRTFPGVEHRMEVVTETSGVLYINDSKATNIDAARYALETMTRPVIWIVGGTDKGNDYSVLNDLVRSKVRRIVAMGADNTKILKAFRNICPVEDTHSLEEAVKSILRESRPGDAVLLSPCCASFDLFENYEDRGRKFKEAVLNAIKDGR